MKEFDEILRRDSGYVTCSSNNLVYFIEGFPFWNSKVISREFSSRYKLHIIYFSLTDINIRTLVILFPLSFLYTHIRVLLINLCGICDLFI